MVNPSRSPARTAWQTVFTVGYGKRSPSTTGLGPINHPGQSLQDALPTTTQKLSEPYRRNESSSGNPPKSRGVPNANGNSAQAIAAPPPSKVKQPTSAATPGSPPLLRKDTPPRKHYAPSGGRSYTPPPSHRKCEARMWPYKLCGHCKRTIEESGTIGERKEKELVDDDLTTGKHPTI